MYEQHDVAQVGGTIIREIEDRMRGRSPLPADEKRRKTSVPLSAIERDTLRQRATAAGLPLATFVRSAALGYPITIVPKVNREAWGRLAPLGANLNTIAKAVHQGAKLAGDDPRLMQLIRDTAAAVQVLRRELRGGK